MKRMYYFPGMISALTIPVLFWYYGHKKIDEITTSVIDIGIPAKLGKDKSNLNNTFEPLRNWDYKKIVIPPGKAKENSGLYVAEVKALQERNKKSTGIELILSNENTYGDFVSLLNDMAIAKQDTYAIDLEKTGHLFVTVNYINPNIKQLEYECLLCHDVFIEEHHPDFFDKTQEFFPHLTKEAYYLIIGLLTLFGISMFSIREQHRLPKKRLIH